MATKYDTNPLDPEFPKKARETETKTLPDEINETAKFPPFADAEEPTRYHDKAKFAEYESRFSTAQPLSSYQTTQFDAKKTSDRKVSKIGLPENVLVTLPYLPFSIGLVAGIIELIFVPRSETKVRFHAAQGLAAHIGIWIVTLILGFVGNMPGMGLADFANVIFQAVTIVMMIIFSIKAWKGEPVHIESVDTLTEWLEEKIKPQI